MNYLNNRNLIIVAIVLVLLLGGYYLSGSKKTTTSSKDEGVSDNVDLNNNDKNSSTDNAMKEDSKAGSANVSSTSPATGATVTTKPTEVTVKVSKELSAGSEIKVVSDKNVDVVTGGNKLSSDLKTLTAPVSISSVGTYTVSYTLNWKAGGTTSGSYKFTVK